MQAKIVVRNPFVVMAAAVVIAGGCVTVPTPGELDAQFKAESKARPLGALANGTNAERSAAAGHLRYNNDLTAEEKIGALRNALSDPYGPVRSQAAGSINHLAQEPEARQAIPELRANQADPNAYAALNAILALNALGEPQGALLSAAREVMQRAELDLEDRVFAASLMSDLGAMPEEVATTLVDGLSSGDESIRGRAFNDLASMKAMPASTLPRFVHALEATDNETVKLAALLLNQSFRPPPAEVVPAATAALARGDGDLNENLLTLLSATGAGAAGSVPAIVELLNRQPRATRNERVGGVTALGSIGTESDEVVDTLIRVAESDPDPQVRQVAMMTASRFTVNTARIRTFLEKQARDGATEADRGQAEGNLRMLDAMQQLKNQ